MSPRCCGTATTGIAWCAYVVCTAKAATESTKKVRSPAAAAIAAGVATGKGQHQRRNNQCRVSHVYSPSENRWTEAI